MPSTFSVDDHLVYSKSVQAPSKSMTISDEFDIKGHMLNPAALCNLYTCSVIWMVFDGSSKLSIRSSI